MKRSEAVNVIKDILLRNDFEEAVYLCGTILNALEEEVGMSPPSYRKRLTQDEREEFTSNCIQWYTYVDVIQEWESEEE